VKQIIQFLSLSVLRKYEDFKSFCEWLKLEGCNTPELPMDQFLHAEHSTCFYSATEMARQLELWLLVLSKFHQEPYFFEEILKLFLGLSDGAADQQMFHLDEPNDNNFISDDLTTESTSEKMHSSKVSKGWRFS
jgi:hypothetical protein